jgi:16S rRNA (cytosine1402-N4)-methyltransferase
MGAEVVELMLPTPAGLLVDGTVGGGGHASLLLDARADWRYLALDRDADALAAARSHLARFGDRVEYVQAEFGHLAEVVGERGDVVGLLLDLGVSSAQLDRPERGFSYRFDAPLDMRMDARSPLTAADVVNEYDEDELASLIATNGEERYARRIARQIVRGRPLVTTRELADAIARAIPGRARRRGLHPARRTFQAIRMEVNRELANLADGLDDAVRIVSPDGRIVVLSYHSLEDRIVKERFATWSGARQPAPPRGLPVEPVPATPLVRLLTARPLRPRPVEIAANPRAESARLRAVQRLAVVDPPGPTPPAP